MRYDRLKHQAGSCFWRCLPVVNNTVGFVWGRVRVTFFLDISVDIGVGSGLWRVSDAEMPLEFSQCGGLC